MLNLKMIDPIISLAFTIHSNKGVYCLLLGSGISRPAQIPTGWEIVLDLICKVAALEGKDCEPSPYEWFKENFKHAPSYHDLLNNLANSPSERRGLLKQYFEPTDKEREEGIKAPTKAHLSIAGMVKSGYIKVIITTNFDRLLEQALQEAGINPIIIGSIDAIKGAPPLQHNECAIIKVNGDYLDTRIRNTEEELGKYPSKLKALLDRIFDDYGLVICGWSAEWDTALRDAIKRSRNFRYSCYWCTRGRTTKDAEDLIVFRKAIKIVIKDADSFFSEILEKVRSLEKHSLPHPLSSIIAVTQLKRYIRDESKIIDLHNFIVKETEYVYEQITSDDFSLTIQPTDNLLNERVESYCTISDTLIHLFVNGCKWGAEIHESLWIKCIQRLTNFSDEGGNIQWKFLKYLPGLILAYAGGIVSIYTKNYKTLRAILLDTKIEISHESNSLAEVLNVYIVLDLYHAKHLKGVINHKTPLSAYLESFLRPYFTELIPNDDEFVDMFDKFEYFFALLYVDLNENNDSINWAPSGCFAGRNFRLGGSRGVKLLLKEVDDLSENWDALKEGFFNGSVEQFLKTAGTYKDRTGIG